MQKKIKNIYTCVFISSAHICFDLQQCCVCIRLFVYKTSEHFIHPSKCSKNISNSEWVFYSTIWGSNKLCVVGSLTYPLADSLVWPKCLMVLQPFGNVLNTASSAGPREQGAPLRETQPQVRWAEEWKAAPSYVLRKDTFGPNTRFCHCRKLRLLSHSPIPLPLLSLQSPGSLKSRRDIWLVFKAALWCPKLTLYMFNQCTFLKQRRSVFQGAEFVAFLLRKKN